MRTILFVHNAPDTFLSHRLPLALAAQQVGFDVHVATTDGPAAAQLKSSGFTVHALRLDRSGTNLAKEFSTILAMFRLYRQLRPDIVHHTTIKPVLYGSIIARMVRVPNVVNAITGLGYVFVTSGLKVFILRGFVQRAYRVALANRNSAVIFQNSDDLERFIRQKLVDQRRTTLIRGSGVDLNQFAPAPPLEGPPTVLLASRMLWDKGVGEFVSAAAKLRARNIKAKFVLAGDSDPGNRRSIPESQLKAWHESGVVEWWGHRPDMPAVFQQCHIVCLPSSYGEGVPKVLIEAAASGRPIVTTKVPGCHEIVKDGWNGVLVSARDPDALADAIQSLIEDPALGRTMGRNGRELVEAEFSVEHVVARTLDIYSHLLMNGAESVKAA